MSATPVKRPVPDMVPAYPPAVTTTHHPAGASRGEFDRLYNVLGVGDPHVKPYALALYERFLQLDMIEDERQHFILWAACALYTANRSRVSTTVGTGQVLFGAGLSLSQILKKGSIKLMDFFEHFKVFIQKLGVLAPTTFGEERLPLTGGALKAHESHLYELEKRFLVLTYINKRFEKMFSELFTQTPTPAPLGPDHIQRTVVTEFDVLKSTTWNLFIIALNNKDVIQPPPDILVAFKLLICCIQFMLHTASPASLAHALDSSYFGPSDGQDNHQRTLRLLATGVELASVETFYRETFSPFINNLFNQGGPFAQHGIAGLRSLMAESLVHTAASLNREYDVVLMNSGGFDERLVTTPEAVGTPSKLSTVVRNMFVPNHATNRNLSREFEEAGAAAAENGNGHFDGESGTSTPSRMLRTNSQLPPSQGIVMPTPPQTPMTNAMALMQWIHTVQPRPEITPGLRRYLTAGSEDMTAPIVNRAQRLADSLKLDQDKTNKVIHMYFRVLESLLHAEEQRLKMNNFTILLSNESFHRGLLACTGEVVAFASKATHLVFPEILRVMELSSFELCKIIESFIRHEPTLPIECKRHLREVEERILEQDAWTAGSQLLTALTAGSEHEAMVLVQLANASAMPPAGHAHPGEVHAQTAFSSPAPPPKVVRSGSGAESAAASSSDGAHPAPAAPRGGTSHTIALFFKKLLNLAHRRVSELCARLGLSPTLLHQVWLAVTTALERRRDLMINRHLDQLIMCSVYGVCRANNMADITFRSIIDQYKNQPQCVSAIFRSVLLEKPGEHGDIIEFYNKIYIPCMKAFLMAAPAQTAQLPPMSYATSSPRRVASSNLTVSPMRPKGATTPGRGMKRPHEHDPSMTPSTKNLFNFGESPSGNLRIINRTLQSGPSKVLFPEAAAEGDETPTQTAKRPKYFADRARELMQPPPPHPPVSAASVPANSGMGGLLAAVGMAQSPHRQAPYASPARSGSKSHPPPPQPPSGDDMQL